MKMSDGLSLMCVPWSLMYPSHALLKRKIASNTLFQFASWHLRQMKNELEIGNKKLEIRSICYLVKWYLFVIIPLKLENIIITIVIWKPKCDLHELSQE